MPTIIWEGNKKEFGTSHKCSELHENAVQLREADGFIGKAMLYGCLLYTSDAADEL